MLGMQPEEKWITATLTSNLRRYLLQTSDISDNSCIFLLILFSLVAGEWTEVLHPGGVLYLLKYISRDLAVSVLSIMLATSFAFCDQTICMLFVIKLSVCILTFCDQTISMCLTLFCI